MARDENAPWLVTFLGGGGGSYGMGASTHGQTPGLADPVVQTASVAESPSTAPRMPTSTAIAARSGHAAEAGTDAHDRGGDRAGGNRAHDLRGYS